MPSFTFYSWPNDAVVAQDEFAAPGWHLTFYGSTLEILLDDPAGTEDTALQTVANPYVAAFAVDCGAPRFTVITEREFLARTNPPHSGTFEVVAPDRAERDRLSRAMKAARQALLSAIPNTEPLRRCYDYLQAAREDEESALPILYKAYEVLREQLGGERGLASKLLAPRADLKRFTRLANEPQSDERHAPTRGQRVIPATAIDRQRAYGFVASLAHRYAKLV